MNNNPNCTKLRLVIKIIAIFYGEGEYINAYLHWSSQSDVSMNTYC
jgi:hypothetical protein